VSATACSPPALVKAPCTPSGAHDVGLSMKPARSMVSSIER
jgi:hypothetical protein